MKIITTIKGILTLGLLLLSTLTCADIPSNNTNSNWYQVNIIVFEHITPRALMSEQWSTITNPPNISQAITPQFLPQDKSQLKHVRYRLDRRRDYKILADVSWQQRIPVSDHARSIRIIGGQKYNGTYQLDGTLTITRFRYFNVNANLVLTEPTGYLNQFGSGNYAASIVNCAYKSFQMRQNLRIKSKELGYLDHPLFGVLIEINQLKNHIYSGATA